MSHSKALVNEWVLTFCVLVTKQAHKITLSDLVMRVLVIGNMTYYLNPFISTNQNHFKKGSIHF